MTSLGMESNFEVPSNCGEGDVCVYSNIYKFVDFSSDERYDLSENSEYIMNAALSAVFSGDKYANYDTLSFKLFELNWLMSRSKNAKRDLDQYLRKHKNVESFALIVVKDFLHSGQKVHQSLFAYGCREDGADEKYKHSKLNAECPSYEADCRAMELLKSFSVKPLLDHRERLKLRIKNDTLDPKKFFKHLLRLNGAEPFEYGNENQHLDIYLNSEDGNEGVGSGPIQHTPILVTQQRGSTEETVTTGRRTRNQRMVDDSPIKSYVAQRPRLNETGESSEEDVTTPAANHRAPRIYDEDDNDYDYSHDFEHDFD
uniref:Uncharacterized protein n=1 Tax=Panagrolaimus sp. PS1159 TaxID=55785 RepID=A0AC35GU38_9BILA